jgi:magnesium chelatase family protein
MPLATAHGVVIDGVSGVIVRVEVSVADGLPSFGVVGLPDASVAESRWRARCAVEASQEVWPNRRITVSLSPAELRKHGAGLDLPIAVGVLTAAGRLPESALVTTAFIGELGLDGRLRPSRGLLAAVLAARAAGFSTVVVPCEGTHDLSEIPGMRVTRAVSLAHVCAVLTGDEGALSVTDCGDEVPPHPGQGAMGGAAMPGCEPLPDLQDVRGHELARWALEVAAAGGHHVAMTGAPGVGKTLLATRLPGLLPCLQDDEAWEVASIHSVAGLVREPEVRTIPPLLAPHHSASAASLFGSVSGARVVPGAVTLAHRGVLFLDEAPEFTRPALEGLRQPMESGVVTLGRTGWTGTLPARFQLVIAANPCPCGMRVGTGAECSCSASMVRRYASKLSGPILDRIDIRLSIERPAMVGLESEELPESSSRVALRVRAARERAAARFEGFPWRVNAEVPAGELRRRWQPAADGAELLRAFEQRSANLRGVDRVLRMAWTLTDLKGADAPDRDDVAGALSLRGGHLGWPG